MKSTANTVWQGTLMDGSGTVALASGAAPPMPVSWTARTERADGRTNPEELIAAAHATCFSMALSHGLTQAGTPPTRLETETVATFGQTDDGFRITAMALTVRGEVPGLDEAGFGRAAEEAKVGCPVSQALQGNVELSVEAGLL